MKSALTLSVFSLAVVLGPTALGQSMVPAGNAPAGPPVQYASASQDAEQARQLFFVADGTGEGKNPGLRVRVYQTVSMPNGTCETVQVPVNKSFATGERVRFSVESNSKGYLHILQRGSSGAYTILFPLGNQPNEIRRGVEVPVPATGSFQFDATPGTETLYFVFTKKKTNVFNYLIPPAGGGQVPSPSSGSIEYNIVQSFQRGQRDLIVSPLAPAAPVMAGTPASAPSWNNVPFFAVAQGSKDFLVVPVQLAHN